MHITARRWSLKHHFMTPMASPVTGNGESSSSHAESTHAGLVESSDEDDPISNLERENELLSEDFLRDDTQTK